MNVYKCYWELSVHLDCHTMVCAENLCEAIKRFESFKRGVRLQGVVEELTDVIVKDGIIASTNRFP